MWNDSNIDILNPVYNGITQRSNFNAVGVYNYDDFTSKNLENLVYGTSTGSDEDVVIDLLNKVNSDSIKSFIIYNQGMNSYGSNYVSTNMYNADIKFYEDDKLKCTHNILHRWQ